MGYRPIRGLAHVAGCEGAVETGGGFGEFARRHFEKASGGTDELGGDVASAAGAAHVVEGLLDCGHVEFLVARGCAFMVCLGVVWYGQGGFPIQVCGSRRDACVHLEAGGGASFSSGGAPPSSSRLAKVKPKRRPRG